MKNKKIILIYLLIILLFIMLSFMQWILEFNMTFEYFIQTLKNIDFVKQWHYLTYANSKIFILIYPMIITYFGIKDFFNIYHSGMLYSISEKIDYKKYIKNTFLNIFKTNCFVYLTFILLMLIVSLVLFKFDTNTLYLIGVGSVNYLIFAGLSMILSVIFSIFILNIGLTVTRYCKKFSLTIIISYLVFISLAIVSETIIGSLVESILKLDGIYNSFSIFNMVILDGNIYGICIYSIILFIVSTFIVFEVYKDKDKVLMEYE